MVDFTRKRLQVFVSSTYTDLKQERQAAVEAILSHGHIAAGMELFTSGDESQWEVIKQWIAESDVYLLILGGRYGSIEPKTNKSYTHLEYEYALEIGKPSFACVVNQEAQKERIKQYGDSVIEMDNPKELKEFRKLVESKIVKYWSDCKDIKIVVGETMGNYARREDLIGWVRANQINVNPAIAEELARLSKENEQLRNQLANIEPKEELINGLSFSDIKRLIEYKGLLNFFYKNRILFSRNNAYYIDFDFDFQNDESNDNKYYRFIDITKEICLFGLIESSGHGRTNLSSGSFPYETFKLTVAGRAFLNKLEAEKLKLKKESSALTDNKNL